MALPLPEASIDRHHCPPRSPESQPAAAESVASGDGSVLRSRSSRGASIRRTAWILADGTAAQAEDVVLVGRDHQAPAVGTQTATTWASTTRASLPAASRIAPTWRASRKSVSMSQTAGPLPRPAWCQESAASKGSGSHRPRDLGTTTGGGPRPRRGRLGEQGLESVGRVSVAQRGETGSRRAPHRQGAR